MCPKYCKTCTRTKCSRPPELRLFHNSDSKMESDIANQQVRASGKKRIKGEHIFHKVVVQFLGKCAVQVFVSISEFPHQVWDTVWYSSSSSSCPRRMGYWSDNRVSALTNRLVSCNHSSISSLAYDPASSASGRDPSSLVNDQIMAWHPEHFDHQSARGTRWICACSALHNSHPASVRGVFSPGHK